MDKKAKVRFNIIDFIIIFCIASACVAFVYYIDAANKKSVALYDKTLEYTLKISDIAPSSADLYVVGDNISEKSTLSPIGSITGVKKQPHEFFYINGGDYVYAQDNTKSDVYLKVECKYTETENSFILGSYAIKTGENAEIFTDRISCVAEICDISLKN